MTNRNKWELSGEVVSTEFMKDTISYRNIIKTVGNFKSQPPTAILSRSMQILINSEPKDRCMRWERLHNKHEDEHMRRKIIFIYNCGVKF